MVTWVGLEFYSSDQSTSHHTVVTDYADNKAIISLLEKHCTAASSNLQTHLYARIWYHQWHVKPNENQSRRTTFTLRQNTAPL